MPAILLLICMAASSANACFVCVLPYQSLLDKVESSEQVVVARAIDQQQTQWKVVRILRGDGSELGQVVAANSKWLASNNLQILRRDEGNDPWKIESQADRALVDFLDPVARVSRERSPRRSTRQQALELRYFLPFLEHAHPQIADSSYNKLARAPYEAIRLIAAEFAPDQLMVWIEDPQIGPKRGSLYIKLLGICGGPRELTRINQWIDEGWERQDTENLGALLAARAELRGEQAIGFIEASYLQNRDRSLGELIAAVNALRVHGQTNGKVSRSRIMASFQLLLRERPALLEMIVDDCARWEEWGIAPKLMELYASGKQPWNNAMIIKYLEACPLPQAKHFVKRVNDDEP